MNSIFYGYDSMLKKFKSCMESIDVEDWYGNGPTDIFANRNARVLGFTHEDLDGVAAGVVLKNFYHNIDLQFINYGSREKVAYEYARNIQGNYDCIVLTDYTPTILTDFKALGVPVLVIDHHDAVKAKHNPSDNVFIEDGKCGAYRALQYFSAAAPDLHKLDDLCYYANIADLFLYKKVSPDDAFIARRLRDLCGIIAKSSPNGFNDAVSRFINGDIEFTMDESNILAAKEQEDDAAFKAQEKIALPENGVLVSHVLNFSAMNEKIDDAGYAYAVHKLSKVFPTGEEFIVSLRLYPDNFPIYFRNKYNGDNIAMQEEANVNILIRKVNDGEGAEPGEPVAFGDGGGHPCAGGCKFKTEAEQDLFIKQYANVVAKMLRCESGPDVEPVPEMI